MGERTREALVACGRGEIPLVDALEAFVRSSGALATGLTLWRDGAFMKQTWVGLPAEFERAYVERFHAADPWIGGVRSVATGKVLVSDELVPRDELTKSAFHAELCRPHRIRDIYGGPLARKGRYEVTLGVLRGADARGEGTREAAQLVGLVPELRRVAEAEIEGFRTALTASALDALPYGAFVVDVGRLAVVLANAAGEALLAAGTVVSGNGKLTVDGEPLQGWLTTSVHGRHTTKRSGVRVSALPPRITGGVRVRDLYVHDTVAVSHELAARARRAHGLSEREAQIARQLLLGKSPKEIAVVNGVSVATMRSQLRSLYAKIGVEGQTQLVCALSSP